QLGGGNRQRLACRGPPVFPATQKRRYGSRPKCAADVGVRSALPLRWLNTTGASLRCPSPARMPAAPRGVGRSSAETPSVSLPLDAFLFLEEGQVDAIGDVRVADDRLGVATLGDRVEILEQPFADHDDSEVARPEVLLCAVGDAALTDPGDDVLVDDVARDPAAMLVLDRTHPGRHAPLHVGFAPLRHAHEEPSDAECVLVVDRNAPFE